MAAANLVTGSTGTAHIKSSDAGALNAAIFGSKDYVLGNSFEATLMSNNLLTIGEGEMLIQGRHARIDAGNTVDIVIENGTQGQKRMDLVVFRYTKDSAGKEAGEWDIIKGTSGTTAVRPSVVTGDILHSATKHESVLFEITLDGITVTGVKAVYNIVTDYNTWCTAIAGDLKTHSHTWSAITGKPTTFPPAAHNHAWSTVTGKPSTYPPSGHTHDDRYYTEAEINAKLNGKATLTADNTFSGTSNRFSREHGVSLDNWSHAPLVVETPTTNASGNATIAFHNAGCIAGQLYMGNDGFLRWYKNGAGWYKINVTQITTPGA